MVTSEAHKFRTFVMLHLTLPMLFLASFSPRNFFRAKKHNLEKNRMEKEEKLFRERFQVCSLLKVIINRTLTLLTTRNIHS